MTANWHPDPTGEHELRYWDGRIWTEHVADQGVQSISPLPTVAPARAAEQQQQADQQATAAEAERAEAERSTVAEEYGVAEDPFADRTDEMAAEAVATTPTVDTTDQQVEREVTPGQDQAAQDEVAEAEATSIDQTSFGPDAAIEPATFEPEAAVEESTPEVATDDVASPAPEVVAETQDALVDPVAEPSDDPQVPDVDDLVAEQTADDIAEPEPVVEAAVPVAENDPFEAGNPLTAGPVEDAPGVDPAGETTADDGESTGAVLAAGAAVPAAGAAAAAAGAGAATADAAAADDVAPLEQDEPQQDEPQQDEPAPVEASADAPGTAGISGDLIDGRFAEVGGDGAALQNNRMLRVRVGESFLARQGSMVAYQGGVTFAYQGSGAAKFLKKAVTGEGLSLMRVEGQGDVFLADAGKHVHILNLNGSGISVNGASVLAFSSSLEWNVERVKGGSIAAGGLFNTTLRGTGWVAITTDGEPVVLDAAEAPTFADTDAIVAWSADLQTSLNSTMTAGGAIGRGSGEAVQVTFAGQGFVIVQPSEGRATAQ